MRRARAAAAAAALFVVHALFALYLALCAAAAALRRALPAPSECLLCRVGAAALRVAPLPAALRRRLQPAAVSGIGAPPGVVGFSFGGSEGAAAHPADVAALVLAAVAAGARHVLLYDAAGELEHAAEALAAALAAAAPAAAPGARLVLGGGRGAARACVALPAPRAPPDAAPTTLWLLSPRDAAEPMLRLAREGVPATSSPLDDVSASAAVCAAEAALARRGAGAPPPPPPVAALFLVGPAPCLEGFPPWLLAGAELYHLGTLRGAARRGGVADGVGRFRRTAQRLGK